MLAAKKQLTPSPLSIIKTVSSPVEPGTFYKPPAFIKKATRPSKPDLDHLPFDQWNIPKQEEGYIRGRENDFL